MAGQLDELLRYFPAGATESETHILTRAFVYQEHYEDLITPPPTSPRIMVGRKGTGKTAIIFFYQLLLREAGVPNLRVRPRDIRLDKFPESAALGEYTRLALEALSSAIARKITSSNELKGLISSSAKPLLDEALSAGDREPDIVSKMADLLPRIAASYGGFGLPESASSKQQASLKRLHQAIKENIEESGSTFHVFLDDVDQVAAPNQPQHLQRIWALLLACRELAMDVPQLRVVISLREEVWRRLKRDSASQRDQTDHFLPLTRELFPSREQIWEVVERRLELACEDVGDPRAFPTEPFFEGYGANMPYTDTFRSWRDLIVIRSRERPRDAIQMIRLLANAAKQNGDEKINEAVFHRTIQEFSEQRVATLANELEEECPQIVEVVESFADVEYDEGSFKASFEKCREVMRRIPSKMSVKLHGRRLTPQDDDDALKLWRYLYELGIINARVRDTRMKDNFKHIQPREDPRLVSRSRWNDMQATVWEVNPAYRDHLIKVQEDLEARRD